MTNQVPYADIVDKETDGENAALLINDTKRAINEVITEADSYGNVITRNTGTQPAEIPTNADLPTSAKTGSYSDLTDLPALGTAATVNTGTAQNEIELNSQKTFRSFDSLTSAIAFVTANPDTIERLSTASYRNEAECTALGIDYPDGGADYVVEPLGTPDGYGDHAAGSNQLTLRKAAPINIKKFGALVDGVTSDESAINSAKSVGTIYIPTGVAISDSNTPTTYYGSGIVKKSDTSYNRAFLKVAQGDTEKTIVPVYGALRQNTEGSGWELIDDAAHAPNGLESVVATSLGIDITYRFTATKVGTLLINNDETLCSSGIIMGASVGASSATIFFYRDMIATVSNTTLNTATAITFDAPTAVLNGDSTITVTHSNTSAADFQKPILSVSTSDGNTAQQIPMLVGYNRNTVTYGMYKPVSGYIYYNGSQWVVETNDKNKPTVVAGSTGIVVTHETLRDGKMQVTGRDNGSILALVGNATATTFVVAFREFTGALVNPSALPSTDMRFYYSGADLVQQENSFGNVDILREKCILNPSKIFGITSNFWISGDFEI